ncbi:DUF4260 domain-containing protein [Bartonella sp. HY761]|uniref:DUF4260 domain-containing protein n=1 Tax=Bartonella sp. HY761 TaxID=2979330 RepID=UPI00220818DF|nr:DUF4260 domain-containing protein [Bartonella sp. HY761]UXN06988.1 DUF4260 domain-containing protein [Bartonella sp. HY761]
MFSFNKPNHILRIEALFFLVAVIFIYWKMQGSWLLFAILFFVPDISIIAYKVSRGIGSTIYNLFHTTIFAVILVVIGLAIDNQNLLSIGLIWAAHIEFDRVLGYGLKYPTGFQDTHLGKIGGVKQ